MWVLGAMVQAAGALFITSRPPASTAYSLTHFLPLSQKAFAGAAALEVVLRKRRKETGLQSAAYNRPTPFLPQWAPSGPESTCFVGFHSTPYLLISLPLTFPSCFHLISASRDSSPLRAGVNKCAHNTRRLTQRTRTHTPFSVYDPLSGPLLQGLAHLYEI